MLIITHAKMEAEDNVNYYYYNKKVTLKDGTEKVIRYRKAKNLVANPKKRGPKRKPAAELADIVKGLSVEVQQDILDYAKSKM